MAELFTRIRMIVDKRQKDLDVLLAKAARKESKIRRLTGINQLVMEDLLTRPREEETKE